MQTSGKTFGGIEPGTCFQNHCSGALCLTSIAVVQVGELVPLVVLDEAEEGPLDVGPHLDDELLVPIQGEAGRDEGDVERPAERRDGVDRLLVVESENGVDPPRELRTDWKRR